jgi:hypothetical protein
MRGNANAGEKGELLSPSFAGITLIRFYGYDLSLALGGTPRELCGPKIRKESFKGCNISTPYIVLQQIQLL